MMHLYLLLAAFNLWVLIAININTWPLALMNLALIMFCLLEAYKIYKEKSND